MVQLSPPSAASEVLTVADALDAIAAALSPIVDRETLPLAAADGRVLAAPAVAMADLPPFANAAVDGYAVAMADLAAADHLPVLGRAAAGTAPDRMQPGTCRRIFTGAPLPHGADTVFMQEDVALGERGATFLKGLSPGDNVRARGEDMARGAEAVPRGRRLRPQDLALAAAVGIATVRVVRPLRAALFSTGNELVEPGALPRSAQRYDSNRLMLAALLGRAGVSVTDLGILPDDRAEIADALLAAEEGHDLVVTSGGVSVGEEDHVKAALSARGNLALWRLAIKPGRPLAFGHLGTVPFFGLPGNPVAAFVTYARVLRPALARMTGEDYSPAAFRVLADFSHRKRNGLREYVRATLGSDSAGLPRASKHAVEGAANLSSLTGTQGLVELGEDVTEVEPGQPVSFLPYDGLI